MGNNQTTITKERIADKLKTGIGFSAAICEEIVSTVFNQVVELAKRDSKVIIRKFGTWKINNKKSRPGFNIHKGSAVAIEPRTVLRLVPSKILKETINRP